MVVVEEGRVKAAGRRETVSVPADAVKIDGEGLTLLPGLIDCHVHLSTHGDGLDLGQILMTPPSLSVLTCVVSAHKTLEAGFTTVRDAGMTPAGVRTAIERGYFPGPRLLVAITILSQTGGHADDHFPCGALVRWVKQDDIPGEIVDGVEPMRLRVREIIRAGADWVKICTSGGVLSPGDDPHHAHFTIDEIRACVEEAARAGKKVMSHAQAAEGIKNALRAGVYSIEHGIYLDEDGIELMLDGGNPLVPTLVAPVWVERHAAAGRMAPFAAEKARMVAKDHKANIKRAIEAGVKIAFGTDTGVGPHGSNGEEFLLPRRAGHVAPRRAALGNLGRGRRDRARRGGRDPCRGRLGRSHRGARQPGRRPPAGGQGRERAPRSQGRRGRENPGLEDARRLRRGPRRPLVRGW